MSRKITPGSFKTRRGAVICVYTLLIRYHEQRYGLELKRFRSDFEYDAGPGRPLCAPTPATHHYACFFVEVVDDETRAEYEVIYHDAAGGVTVEPVLVTTME